MRIADNNTAPHLYRIAQEAINNAIVKHGKAEGIVVGLVHNDGAIKLSIKDDGVGLPKTDSKTHGIGLRVMNYRAGMIGATLTLESQRNGGTQVHCQLPVSEAGKNPAKKGKANRVSVKPAAG
ncbi:MAG: ATP-binding protein [Verrucomicrobiota bacterium]